MNNDITKQIESATADYLRSDKMKEHIQTQAESMVNKIIDDVFGSWGTVKKQLEEAINNELKINVKKLGLSGHNQFISEIVAEKLGKSLREESAKKIQEQMDAILSPIEKTVTIKQLKEVLLGGVNTYALDLCISGDLDLDHLDEYGLDEDELFTFNMEESDHGWIDIYMDSEPNKSDYDCEFNITVHENFCSFKIRGRNMKAKDLAFNSVFDMEAMMYKMFLNESVIEYEEAKKNLY